MKLNRTQMQTCIKDASSVTESMNNELLSKMGALLDSKSISFDELTSCLGITKESLAQMLYNRVCNFTIYQSFVIGQLYDKATSLMQEKPRMPQMRDYYLDAMSSLSQPTCSPKSYSQEDIELTNKIMNYLQHNPQMLQMIENTLK